MGHPHQTGVEAIDKKFDELEKQSKTSVFIVDAALIYESGLDQRIDYVIVVTAHYGVRMQRAIQRGRLDRREIQKRMDLQLPEESKIGMSDYVIDNNGTEEDLIKQVDDIYKALI